MGIEGGVITAAWMEKKLDKIDLLKIEDLLRDLGEDPEAIDKETGLHQWFVALILLIKSMYPDYGDENSSSVSSRI